MGTMRRSMWLVGLLVAGMLAPSSVLACEPSASGAWSFELRVSPRAGDLCLYLVELHHDATCEAEPEARFEVSCGEARRATVTDEGAYVAVLAPRASHRGWPIVRVFERAGEGVVARTLTLAQLDLAASVGARPRVRLDARAIVLEGGGVTRTVALANAVSLARERPVDRGRP